MLPSATKYNEYNEEYKDIESRTNICYPLAEIKRISQKIFELNKLQKFPFEIPLLVRKVLFQGFYQHEYKLFKEMQLNEFPDHSLAQAMAIVQHEFRGTTLLDFTMNKFKALFFAIGDDLSKDSYIFGLPVSYFETHKNNLDGENISGEHNKYFDLLYPSYFMNDRIAQQEGVFLYQKFKVCDDGSILGDKKYVNIIEYFEKCLKKEQDKEEKARRFNEITIDEFIKLTEKDGEKPIFYLLLKVKANEKKPLKIFLDSIGITENYIMNAIGNKKCSGKADFV
jgi:hypothetical protein